jgi:hypothetical protein
MDALCSWWKNGEMKQLTLILAVALAPCIALAQSAIDGKWKTDVKSISGSDKPSKYFVKDGMYECESCVPQIKVKADGADQLVEGNPYFDVYAVKLTDDRTMELVARKAGRTISVGKISVSADGKTMSREFTINEPGGLTNKYASKMTRVAPAPKGTTHGVSGSWKLTSVDKLTDDTVIFRTAGGAITMNATDGSRYEAKLDGTKAPFKGSSSADTVSVVMRDKNTFEEINWLAGKLVSINTMVVAPDGKSLRVNWESKLNGAKGSFTMTKQ